MKSIFIYGSFSSNIRRFKQPHFLFLHIIICNYFHTLKFWNRNKKTEKFLFYVFKGQKNKLKKPNRIDGALIVDPKVCQQIGVSILNFLS